MKVIFVRDPCIYIDDIIAGMAIEEGFIQRIKAFLCRTEFVTKRILTYFARSLGRVICSKAGRTVTCGWTTTCLGPVSNAYRSRRVLLWIVKMTSHVCPLGLAEKLQFVVHLQSRKAALLSTRELPVPNGSILPICVAQYGSHTDIC